MYSGLLVAARLPVKLCGTSRRAIVVHAGQTDERFSRTSRIAQKLEKRLREEQTGRHDTALDCIPKRHRTQVIDSYR